ncbi:hypothetical protein BLA18110_07809 [Burkholderia lata]|nr:hypothetical protein BLA18110_07809 [Burkholderia lata]
MKSILDLIRAAIEAMVFISSQSSARPSHRKMTTAMVLACVYHICSIIHAYTLAM